MNKSELIQSVAESTGQPKAEVGKMLDALLETVMTAVANGDSVALLGFGTFKQGHREARQGRNPTTGASIAIAAKTFPKFLPGGEFKRRVGTETE
jgi:DNA-binding protein HU-beta